MNIFFKRQNSLKLRSDIQILAGKVFGYAFDQMCRVFEQTWSSFNFFLLFLDFNPLKILFK